MTIQSSQSTCTIHRGDGPIVAVAIHDAFAIRDELLPLLELSDDDRLREQDAHTSIWTNIATTRVVATQSRFEVDLNRPRSRSVYLAPEDAWGLQVWKQPPSEAMIKRSRTIYDDFYDQMRVLFDQIADQHGCFFVYDLHSYNHRRGGADLVCDDPEANPQINICTGGMDLDRCGSVVDEFEHVVRQFPFPTGPLDVRRNVRYRATRFSRWVHENYPGVGVSMALEISKFYMDEWTGQPHFELLHGVTEALRSTVAPVEQALRSLTS